MTDLLARLREEHIELHKRTRKLTEFLANPEAFGALPEVQQQLLRAQHGHMVNYRYILEQRMAHIQADRELNFPTQPAVMKIEAPAPLEPPVLADGYSTSEAVTTYHDPLQILD